MADKNEDIPPTEETMESKIRYQKKIEVPNFSKMLRIKKNKQFERMEFYDDEEEDTNSTSELSSKEDLGSQSNYIFYDDEESSSKQEGSEKEERSEEEMSEEDSSSKQEGSEEEMSEEDNSSKQEGSDEERSEEGSSSKQEGSDEERSEEKSSEGLSTSIMSEDELSGIPVGNLTQAQLEMLIERKEREVISYKDKIIKMRIEKERMDIKKKKTVREEERFRDIQLHLQEEEEYLLTSMKRLDLLKKLERSSEGTKPSAMFEATKIPQVILCSTWDDTKLPKVVVCATPRIGRMERLSTEFLKVLSPQQLAIIEKEKQWLAIECGKVRLQIAGIKGKIRVLSKENDVLRTLVDTTKEEENINVVLPEDMEKPCYGREGLPNRARLCSKLIPKEKTSPKAPPIEVMLETSPEPKRYSLGEDLRYIEEKLDRLQEDLNKAKEHRKEIEAQKKVLTTMQDDMAKLDG